MTCFRFCRVFPALATVLMLSAGACASGGGDAAASRTDRGATPETPGPPVETEGDLEALLGPAFEAAEARLATAVDRCLTGQGHPALDDGAPVAFGPPPGFGITTTFGVSPDGSPTSAESDAPIDAADEEATSAQLLALFGGPAGDDDPALGWGGGCFGSAAQEIYGDAQPYLDLEEALDDLTGAVEQDPRRRTALTAWRECMQERAGVSPADPEALVATFADQATAEFFVTGEPVEYPTPDDTAAGTPAGEFRAGVDPALLSARQADEQQLADAAVACGDTELDPVEAQIRSELEARFMDEQRDLLDRVNLERFLR